MVLCIYSLDDHAAFHQAIKLHNNSLFCYFPHYFVMKYSSLTQSDYNCNNFIM